MLYINVLGSIDSSNSYDFQVRLNLFIKDKTKIIIDCENLVYISSSGIGAFTYLKTNADTLLCNLLIINVKDEIVKVFDLLGFSNYFELKKAIS
ncbi:MAG: hypothetical protein A2015_04780 [Spirochaetes bacterium GWF1_31_7]|nr:MAG: hypothetical protein A2Y30_05160 [Spirochaetes bacterium GWE1_32_154]OHD48821.1 MAG: hypothetical protein A2Y29_03135 [Spirochaetes bacterium GWE2_31_10]OHD52883.1 MAG: hypothetical protein A2015_04780 [Spirochaetes bacterium GWF1_31_7]